VEAIGDGVASFVPGDRVFGMSPDDFGAHAEYLCLSEKGPLAAMPTGARFNEAVVCEGAWYADMSLQGLGVKPGHRILIYGASGAIGTAAVQLARSYGADVTAVVATRHLDLVKSLGANRAVDYNTQDFTQIGETFDFVLDAVGKTTFFRCRRLQTGGFSQQLIRPCQNPLLTIRSSINRATELFSRCRRAARPPLSTS
jgi:NADPH:quinone reductase-like Zn-dependent oxidoreductase